MRPKTNITQLEIINGTALLESRKVLHFHVQSSTQKAQVGSRSYFKVASESSCDVACNGVCFMEFGEEDLDFFWVGQGISVWRRLMQFRAPALNKALRMNFEA